MKRHEVLQPFSRDHNVGLVIARRLSEGPSKEMVTEFLAIWDEEMADHFAEEERLLIPLATPELSDRLVEEHRRIEDLVRQARLADLSITDIRHLGVLLSDHIRWEERVLFPVLESDPTLSDIASQTSALEQRRAHSKLSPRRGELQLGLNAKSSKDGD